MYAHRALIGAIGQRVPTGVGKGQRQAPRSRRVHEELGRLLAAEGATAITLEMLDIPAHWRHRCEDPGHVGRHAASPCSTAPST